MVADDGERAAGVVRDAGGPRLSGARAPAGSTSRSCARPGCPGTAAATLRFAYHEREAVIEPLGDDHRPQTYDLCGRHAARTRPPHGWTLRDLLPDVTASDGLAVAATGSRGGRDTVALLAAALNAAANGGGRSGGRSGGQTRTTSSSR